mmetsp:Transcript_2991/g.11444  ORF Transcript_2991/g.11444 Transcript_2991/m.11444 type:complete len:1015 (-) Transcript_2991:60-3104(-)
MTHSLFLFTTYLQNTSLLFRQNIHFPPVIEVLRQVFLALLTLDFSQVPVVRNIDFLKEFLSLTRLEFRSRYILICIFIPLSITVVMIALFKNYSIVFWYLGFLFCFALMEMSIIGFISGGGIVLSWGNNVNIALLATALSIAAVLIVFAGIYKIIRIHKGRRRRRKWKKAYKEKLEADKLREKEMEMKWLGISSNQNNFLAEGDPDENLFDQGRRKRPLTFAITFFKKYILKKLGIQMDFQMVDSSRKTSQSYDAPRIIGHFVMGSLFIMFGIAGFILTLGTLWVALWFILVAALGCPIILYGALLTTSKGRIVAYRVYRFVKKWGMRAFLFIMAILYTPILSSIYSGLLCYNQSCPAGSLFPEKLNMFSVETLTVGKTFFDVQSDDVCQFCSFYMPRNVSLLPYYDVTANGSMCSIINEVCPGGSHRLLLEDPTVPCGSIVEFFYLPSTLLFILYVIGLPFIFFIVTLKGVRLLELMRVDFLLDINLPFDPKVRVQKRFRQWLISTCGLPKKLKATESISGTSPGDTSVSPDDIESEVKMFPLAPQQQPTHPVFSSATDRFSQRSTGRIDKYRLTPGQRHALYNDFPLPEGMDATADDTDLPDKPTRLFKVTLQKPEELPPIQRLKHQYVPSITEIRMGLGIPKNAESAEKKLQRRMYKRKLREQWRIRGALTGNPVKSVYASYRRNMRFFRLAIVVYKVVNVTCCILLITLPWLSTLLSMACHLFGLVVLCCTRPYISRNELTLALLGLSLSALNAFFAFIHTFVNLGNGGGIIILILNAPMMIHTAVNLCLYLCIVDFNPNHYYWRRLKKVEAMAKKDPTLPVSIQFVKETKEHITKVDEMLTESSLKWALSFFMFLGIVCFLCLSVCFFGIFRGEFTSPFVSSLHLEEARNCPEVLQHEFLGYGSWKNFTQNCCCQSSPVYSDRLYNVVSRDTYDDVEMWLCRNQQKKERIRTFILDGKAISGLQYRPFCAARFYEDVILDESECPGGGKLLARFSNETLVDSEIVRTLW